MTPVGERSRISSSLDRPRAALAFGYGIAIGCLGGLIGLGGAEFRLPVLIAVFRFVALEAVILNKAMSLIVVASALPFRMGTIPFGVIVARWETIANLLAGSLFGAWLGASWATRLRSETPYRIIAVVLAVIAVVLLVGHTVTAGSPLSTGMAQVVAGVVAGFMIGVVAAVLGVAGGELLIPTLVLLFGANIKRPCEKFIPERHDEASSELQRHPAAFLMFAHGIRNLSRGDD